MQIKIAEILDKYLPADGIGTEREKLRSNILNEILIEISKHEMRNYVNQLYSSYNHSFERQMPININFESLA